MRLSTYWLYEKLVAVSIDVQYVDSKAVRHVLLGLMNLLHLQDVLSNLGV
jgi:hypothetical protein